MDEVKLPSEAVIALFLQNAKKKKEELSRSV